MAQLIRFAFFFSWVAASACTCETEATEPVPAVEEAQPREEEAPVARHSSLGARSSTSLAELGQAVVAHLNEGDGAALSLLTLASDFELYEQLFPRLVANPSVLRMDPKVFYADLVSESGDGIRHALTRHAGKDLTFVGWRSAEVTEQSGLRVHRKPQLVARTTEGEEYVLRIFGPILEDPSSGTFRLMAFD